MTSFKPNYLPKAPSPNTIILEVGASVYGFEGQGTILSIVVSEIR